MEITGIQHAISEHITVTYNISIKYFWESNKHSCYVYARYNINRYTDGYIYFGHMSTAMQAIESAIKACEYNTKIYQQIEEQYKNIPIMSD